MFIIVNCNASTQYGYCKYIVVVVLTKVVLSDSWNDSPSFIQQENTIQSIHFLHFTIKKS